MKAQARTAALGQGPKNPGVPAATSSCRVREWPPGEARLPTEILDLWFLEPPFLGFGLGTHGDQLTSGQESLSSSEHHLRWRVEAQVQAAAHSRGIYKTMDPSHLMGSHSQNNRFVKQ